VPRLEHHDRITGTTHLRAVALARAGWVGEATLGPAAVSIADGFAPPLGIAMSVHVGTFFGSVVVCAGAWW
jgi:hypothetical protein